MKLFFPLATIFKLQAYKLHGLKKQTEQFVNKVKIFWEGQKNLKNSPTLF